MKVQFSKKSVPVKGVLMGCCFAICGTIAGAAIVGSLLHTEKIAPADMPVTAMAVIVLSCLLGALWAGKGSGSRIPAAVCTGAIYFAALVIMNLILFGGRFDGMLTTAFLILGTSLASGMLGIKRGNAPGRRRIRKY